jgi:serine protease Do
VRTALESLLKQGRIIRGYLGIQTRALQPDEANSDADGVIVADVMPGSPAAQAGVQPGDVIHKFDGREVKNFNALRTFVAQTPLNKQVDLQIMRGGKPVQLKTQIKEQPIDYQSSAVMPRRNQPRPQPQGPGQPNAQEPPGGPLSSIHVGELTPQTAQQLDLPANVKGVVVNGVDPDSGVAELRKGDVIEEVNQQPVTSVTDYNKIVASLDPSKPQVLSVCRGRMRSFLVLRPQ